jgi:protein TonB
MTRLQIAIVGGSLLAHLGVYAWMGRLPKERKTNAVAIALAESRKKEEAKKPPPPPPPPPIAPAVKTKVATPAPKPIAPEPPPPSQNTPPPPTAGDAPSAMDGFADLGLAMGGNGIALPAGNGGARGPTSGAARPAEPTTKKVKELAPSNDACTEDPVKPQLAGQVQPAYTAEGRQASIEGVVKLEIAVDENGRVTSVKVVKGLGFGLDDAAVAAAKQWTFKPATKCGRPISYVVKPGVRFQLGS